MKKILFAGLFAILFSCTTGKYVTFDNKRLPSGMVKFLHEFEQAAKSHNSGTIIELLDAEYRNVQLKEFHKGNTESFLNELFCGNYVSKDGFKCLKFNSIKQLNFVKAENNEEGYTVYYKISDGTNEIICSWTVTVKTFNQKNVFGIFGALG